MFVDFQLFFYNLVGEIAPECIGRKEGPLNCFGILFFKVDSWVKSGHHEHEALKNQGWVG